MLWHQSMVSFRNQHENRRLSLGRGHHEEVLYYLINRGLTDVRDVDGRWATSTRSMRHASAMMERLWTIVEH